VRGRPIDALALADQLGEIAHREPLFALPAQLAYGSALYNLGQMTEARVHLDRAAEQYDPEQHRGLARVIGHQDPGAMAYRYRAWTLWVQGYPDQARTSAETGLDLARRLDHRPSIVACLVFLARLDQFVGDPIRARGHADEATALARDQGFAQRLAAATLLRGWADVANGSFGGLEAMQAGLADYRATGAVDDTPYWLALLAEARLAAGQIEAAAGDLAEALAVIDARELRVWEAEVRRLRGEARLASSPEARGGAETDFLDALAVARRQGARSHELRAAMSLARLWLSVGRRAEARELLRPVYDWFTEGFDTHDLKAARELLSDLVAVP
jgi:predicted ATPase